MTTAYTSLLGLALPVQGELSGTWGNMVDNAITSVLDVSVAGTQTITANTDVTLSVTNGDTSATNLAQVGSGTTGSSQYAIINCTGSRTAIRNITAPASSKLYIVINGTTGGFAVVIRGAGPTTGVSVPSGQRALVAWNGSDFVQVGASAGGSTTQVQYNDSGALAGSANMTFNGTTLSLNTLNLTNALAYNYGGTGLTTFTAANYAIYSTSATALTAGTLPVAAGGTGASSAGISAFNNITGYTAAGSTGTTSTNLVFSTSPTLTTATLTQPTFTSYRETVNPSVTVSTSTYNIDLSLANVFYFVLGTNVTFTFTNPPASNFSKPATIILQQDSTGSRLATFTGARYTDGTAPVLSTGANQIDVLTFFTINGGSWYYGTFAMANVS